MEMSDDVRKKLKISFENVKEKVDELECLLGTGADQRVLFFELRRELKKVIYLANK
jgi:hypothetical protein